MADAGSRDPYLPDGQEPFRQVAQEELWHGWILRLTHDTFVSPDGETFERDVLRHPGAVAVVPVHDDGTVTLIHQYRPSVRRHLLEIPAGTRDVDGEPPAETARRELAEEAGLAAAEVRHLLTTRNSPGFTDQETLVFMATGLTACATKRAGVEEDWLSLHRFGWDEIDRLMTTGAIVDSTTLLGLLATRRVLSGDWPPG